MCVPVSFLCYFTELSVFFRRFFGGARGHGGGGCQLGATLPPLGLGVQAAYKRAALLIRGRGQQQDKLPAGHNRTP